jgi:hypothetical protein
MHSSQELKKGAISPIALLMSFTCKSWDLIIIGGLEQTSLANTIFLFITKAKARWRVILTHCFKKWL